MSNRPAPDPASLVPVLDSVLRGAASTDLLAACADRAGDVSTRDRFAALLRIYDLHAAPLSTLGAAARLQHHPAVAGLKVALEEVWLTELDDGAADAPAVTPTDVCDAMRRLAARDRLPDVYGWLSDEASWDELVRFLALEGGPDAGFDDLVAACQTGLRGRAKVELAQNYWDEMGNGSPDDVHTVLHDRLVAAIGMPAVPVDEQPVSALARTAFGGLLATNHWLQPEMLGALGLIELQAGPRCRTVVQAFERLGAPEDAYPFYRVHADVDPIHGKDWLDNAIEPYVDEHPQWADRVLRGARWRSAVDAAFMADAADAVMPAARRAA